MASLISLLRFSVVLQVLIAAAWHFFRWFAWSGDMKLVLRSGIGDVRVGWLVVLMSATLVAWVYLSTLMWKLMRGAGLMYFGFLIWLPLISVITEPERGMPLAGLDILFYMNGAFLFCLTSFTPLRRYFRVIYESGSPEFLRNPKTTLRFFKIGAIFLLLNGMLMQPAKPQPKARCCTKCCTKKSENAEAQQKIGEPAEAVAAPAQ